ncbi:3-hydroxyacyl-CoA dehydrogenase NAD-binding domain-containing protein [Pseudomarimonas salicorniae]|uniref:3-hydroxyacyl-CoA dehydrogenase NAD-binding domain-containing protein n=1 Tax=Pseudomarimonas salicorniae TaxID=2933270 RepID=A0ABT0GEN3_9GAMM|nr:3-hydroxyacyl-CoA dehydrogenase NAD-binding domain-containing protein [Lysobacter sp. CAU 1642]MCK7593003.1 3-hydroxyacyl-CoA dehydrogenase NAD-binding domain-containing protein [Lysobacter sp. CAU 1642]
MSVTTFLRDGIAVITISQPPVNGLGIAVRRGLVEALDAANDNPAVQGIVVTGGARAFSGGADIREFNTPLAMQAPNLPSVIAAFEASPKPCVAAIEGMALGGGLELALGMHGRVADGRAQIGLPEVKLGLLPGAGGTQRFPHAVGLETALNMICSGTLVPAAQLKDTRLFDALAEGDTMDAAIGLAKSLAEAGAPFPKIRDLRVEHPDAEAFLGFARGAVAAASAHYPAPMACLEAVAASLGKDFDAGIEVERKGFAALMATPEARALQHAFFAERNAAKVEGVDASTPRREIRRVGIIGAGTMGGGIAMNFLNAGIPVRLLEMKQEALDRGLATIRGNYESSAKKGRIKPEDVEARMGLLHPTLDYAELGDVDLVIEAVFEEIGVKQQVFERLDAVVREGAILASNTSTLDVDRIAGFTRRPQDVLGMHFFSPANVMKLLEVVRGKATSPEVLATVMDLAKTLRKTAVVSGVCDGFIGNRMIEQYSRQATFLLEEGATPQQVDRAMEKFGFAMGPFRMSDLAGNDIGWAIRKRRYVEQPEMTYSRTADKLCEMGRFGQKTGAGWYDYRPGDRTAHPSQAVEDMLREHAASLGVAPRKISDAEIVERLVYALVNEGAQILAEGIAAKASDIDVVYLTGYGFPVFRGGPMRYADEVGLYNVLRAVRRFAAGYAGDAWQPAPLLIELAEAGKSFNA